MTSNDEISPGRPGGVLAALATPVLVSARAAPKRSRVSVGMACTPGPGQARSNYLSHGMRGMPRCHAHRRGNPRLSARRPISRELERAHHGRLVRPNSQTMPQTNPFRRPLVSTNADILAFMLSVTNFSRKTELFVRQNAQRDSLPIGRSPPKKCISPTAWRSSKPKTSKRSLISGLRGVCPTRMPEFWANDGGALGARCSVVLDRKSARERRIWNIFLRPSKVVLPKAYQPQPGANFIARSA